MTPLGGKPAVVKVQPSDHGSNVESTQDGVEDVVCPRDTCAVGDSGSFDDGTEELGAFFEF